MQHPGWKCNSYIRIDDFADFIFVSKLPYINEATKSGKWLMWELRPQSFEMSGKVHGFIGFGNIGRETAKKSKADLLKRCNTTHKEE
ncbi:NAD(P)-dependent oxidoreductase [Fictibacillus enclensis]|uniref:NAD(P)-dependent oxidoreductase n=1 Tax=Fictibacillus enclensis TaxID=1017270 RepID=UPI003D31FD62